jgi:hypothetical protein
MLQNITLSNQQSLNMEKIYAKLFTRKKPGQIIKKMRMYQNYKSAEFFTPYGLLLVRLMINKRLISQMSRHFQDLTSQ